MIGSEEEEERTEEEVAPQPGGVDFGGRRRRRRRGARCSSVASFMGEGFRWKEFDAGQPASQGERERDEKGKNERMEWLDGWRCNNMVLMMQ